MKRATRPWEFLLVTLSGWVNRHQQRMIDYPMKEDRILKGKYRGKRIQLTDDERRRLVVKGKVLGRKLLGEVASIVTRWLAKAWRMSWQRKSAILAAWRALSNRLRRLARGFPNLPEDSL